MKPYGVKPQEAGVAKWCRKRKRVATRVKVERVYKKAGRRAAKAETPFMAGYTALMDRAYQGLD